MSALLVAALFTAVACAALIITLPAAPPSAARLRARLDGSGAEAGTAPWTFATRALPSGSLSGRTALAAAAALGIVAAAIAGGALAAVIAATATGAAAWWIPRRRRIAREREFLRSLPDALGLVASGLAAGHALPTSLESVARETRGPVGEELSRVVAEARLGLPLDEGLRRVSARMRCPELAWAVEAMAISREVGGELASVLASVAATARERETHRRRVQALTAEGRLSAVVLSLLPPLFALYLATTRRDYVSVLVSEPLGQALSLLALGMLAAGVLWMRLLVHGNGHARRSS